MCLGHMDWVGRSMFLVLVILVCWKYFLIFGFLFVGSWCVFVIGVFIFGWFFIYGFWVLDFWFVVRDYYFGWCICVFLCGVVLCF
eukprot:UN06611